MAEIRLSKLTKQFSIGLQRLVDFLNEKGANVEMNPNAKISDEYLPAIEAKFGEDQKLKKDSEKVTIKLKEIIEMSSKKKSSGVEEDIPEKEVIIKSNTLNTEIPEVKEEPVEVKITPAVEETVKTETKPVAAGPKVIDKIDLSQFDKKPAKKAEEKVVVKDEPKATVVKETVVTANASVGPLLKRAFMFLEDGNWDSANEYAERVLDADPENAEAYLVKLMADLCVRRKEQLADCRTAFDENDNYCKTIRFAGEKLKDEMVGYIEHINIRNENERLAAQYESIVQAMNMATTEDDYKAVAERFAEMGTYSEAARLAKECLEKAEAARIEALERAETARKNAIYANACQLKAKNTIRDLEQAIAKFREISGWKDSQELIYAC